MNLVIFISLTILFVGAVQGTTKNPVVTTTDGRIQGVYSKSYNGKTYMAFLGIPYAKPPVGKLKFEDPEPIDPWTGTKIVNKTTTCLQIEPTDNYCDGIRVGDEDCLHINVYVPGSKIDCTSNLDVIVFIHGGGFMFGSSDSGGPKFLMDRKVILVTFNYRLGVLGFLSTGDKNMPGNYGMKDQVLALKWVQNNIMFFGGNEKSVTLHGHGSGGASVHYHYLSPLSRGLFTRGISSSGCALTPIAFESCPLDKTKIIGETLKCSTNTTKALADCLKKKSAKSLTDAIMSLRTFSFNPITPISVVIDDFCNNPFLPKNPYDILHEKKGVYDVPWISGNVPSNGVNNALEFWVDKAVMKELDKNWCLYAPDLLKYRDVVHASQLDVVSLKIKSFYLSKGKLDENTFPDFIRMISDRLFTTGIGIAEMLHAKAVKSPVLSFLYDYIAETKSEEHILYMNMTCDKLGAIFRDEIMLIYSTNGVKVQKMVKCDEDMKDFLLDMIVSYAAYGKPNIYNWIPIGQCKCNYDSQLYIGRDRKLQIKELTNVGEWNFWKKLPIAEPAHNY